MFKRAASLEGLMSGFAARRAFADEQRMSCDGPTREGLKQTQSWQPTMRKDTNYRTAAFAPPLFSYERATRRVMVWLLGRQHPAGTSATCISEGLSFLGQVK